MRSVAYDVELADRIRELIGVDADLAERRMFGGLAFLIRGNMAVAASSHGGIMVRVDPSESDDLVASHGAQEAVMRGRPMKGWLTVPAEQLGSPDRLAGWVERGVAYARTLPAKTSR